MLRTHCLILCLLHLRRPAPEIDMVTWSVACDSLLNTHSHTLLRKISFTHFDYVKTTKLQNKTMTVFDNQI